MLQMAGRRKVDAARIALNAQIPIPVSFYDPRRLFVEATSTFFG